MATAGIKGPRHALANTLANRALAHGTGRLLGGPTRPPRSSPGQPGGLRAAHSTHSPLPTAAWSPTAPSLARRRVAPQCRSAGAADDERLVSSVGQGRRLGERAEVRHAVLSAEGGLQPHRPHRVPTHTSCTLVAATIAASLTTRVQRRAWRCEAASRRSDEYATQTNGRAMSGGESGARWRR